MMAGRRWTASEQRGCSQLLVICAAFPDLELTTRDFETAAELCNLCITKGVQASHTDFLIAAAANTRGYAVLSADRDFENIARIASVRTYELR
jgi:hypothetical protein